MSAAHEKQWVSTVLSAVDAADLRNLQVACLPSTPELIHQIRGHHKVPSYLGLVDKNATHNIPVNLEIFYVIP